MSIYLRILFSLLLGILLWGCVDKNRDTGREEVVPKLFFDLSGYFEKEISRLSDLQPVLKKRSSINDKTEEKQIKETNFERELAVFKNGDINRTAWMDKYSSDTTFSTQGKLSRIEYKAKEDKLKTKRIFIEFQKDKVHSVTIESQSENIISKFKQQLTYSPEKGYSILSEQDILFSKSKKLSVFVTFLN
ncbi:MAG: hypothetical protein GY705_30940 [Bacteroidetes bacterium]|nr:hypothetical protein [Bacteroidota bacterium]